MITHRVTGLFQDLERGAVAITATRRLARQVEQRYAEWKIDLGTSTWATPRVRAYEDWLLEAWRSVFEHRPGTPLLLSDEQEQLLWERTIRRHAEGDDVHRLLQPTATARVARRTWSLIHEWCLDWDALRRSANPDTRAFMRWAGAVQARLQAEDWLTPAQVPGYLIAHSAAWPGNGAASTWWMGFDAPTPARENIAKLLADRGGRQIRFHNAGAADNGGALVSCTDRADQWERIARWARGRLVSGRGASLGVICSDLRTHREEIEEILEDILHPDLRWRPGDARSFHLSLGRPLSEYPIAASALDLLRWSGHRIPFDVVSRTLRSPYLAAGDQEGEARIELELRLRGWQRETLTLASLRRGSNRGDLPVLSGALTKAAESELPGRADPAAWAEIFSGWLGFFGWPGSRALDSHEFQVQEAWREQLSRFASLGAVQPRFTRSEALKQLAAMTSGRILQFHDDRAPLQVMGVSDAAALWFDEIWLADMSDAVWPPPPQPDPFIPISIQKQRGMPGASAQSALERARGQSRNFFASAGRTQVSYVVSDGEAPSAPSPLFAQLPAGIDLDGDPYAGRRRQLLSAARPLEAVPDSRAPALPDGLLQGGVSLIADQARCPFRAAAHFRLGARALREIEPGLSPAARGVLVHAAARHVWDRIGDQHTLDALDGEALRAVVSGSVDQALGREQHDSPYGERFLAIERRRLVDLFMEWLSVEKRRSPFRVAATEVEMQVATGGGRFRVRVDRIDELEDGRRLIIDYKTGRLAATAEWVDPRMEEPQLPMYALGVDENVAALALAGIRRGECELRGIGEDIEDMPTLKPVGDLGFENMERLKSWWRDAIGTLASDYREGDARVSPKTWKTCQGCDATGLCRIFEQRAAIDD